jgi:CrcB protein
MLNKILLIAVAGAMGSLARYGLGSFVQRAAGVGFPWGTTTVNIIGCLLFGLIWSLAEHRLELGGSFRVFALVGFMGAFTTFSTFQFETAQLLRDSQWLMACGNLLLQNSVGLLAVVGGMALGKLI